MNTKLFTLIFFVIGFAITNVSAQSEQDYSDSTSVSSPADATGYRVQCENHPGTSIASNYFGPIRDTEEEAQRDLENHANDVHGGDQTGMMVITWPKK